eukprot:1500781-Pleurochrysis_carterae.AAC.1
MQSSIPTTHPSTLSPTHQTRNINIPNLPYPSPVRTAHTHTFHLPCRAPHTPQLTPKSDPPSQTRALFPTLRAYYANSASRPPPLPHYRFQQAHSRTSPNLLSHAK